MNFSPKLAIIIGFLSLTFMINLYLGYLGSGTKRFSFKWFLSTHLPIPLVISVRLFLHLDTWYIPVLVFTAITGQILGRKLGV